MADIVKKVNAAIPRNERSQRFSHDDAGAGDVLMVQDSLGKAASKIIVEAPGNLSFRFNVYHHMFPQRELLQDDFNQFNLGVLNLTSGIRYKDDTNAEIQLNSETFILDNGIPVKDIELLTVTGVFEITVM